MMAKKTPDRQAEAFYTPDSEDEETGEAYHSIEQRDMIAGFATCIREKVEPLEAQLEQKTAENVRLRAFIDKFIPAECWGIDAFDGGEVQDVAEQMGILVKVPHAQPCQTEGCNCEGSDYMYYTAWTAKELGFVPTNTQGNG